MLIEMALNRLLQLNKLALGWLTALYVYIYIPNLKILIKIEYYL